MDEFKCDSSLQSRLNDRKWLAWNFSFSRGQISNNFQRNNSQMISKKKLVREISSKVQFLFEILDIVKIIRNGKDVFIEV